MSLFSGVHEVRLLRRPKGIAVGYFDNWEAALRAVEAEPLPYKAAYFTLNPLRLPLPDGIEINPASLRMTSHTADASDIERRVHLLIDCDPPRPAHTNSTDAEKQVAREEAEHIREWLRSQGWPEPFLGDSGNGWHLLYRIELANDDASKALVQNFLAHLKQLFPLVDAGNFEANRLCKLYGSFARKAEEHSEERPWRRSTIVEDGSSVIVTEQQIRALCPAPLAASSAPQKTDDDLSRLLGFLDHYSVPLRSKPRKVPDGWQVEVECPWVDEHSDESPRDTVVSFIAGRGYGFKCLHSHCVNRHWKELREEMEARSPDRKFCFAEPTAEVIVSNPNPPKERKRPVYPIEVWDGTAVGEFAKLCGDDNNVPRKIYAESFRCVLGAVVGDRLFCPVEGALPRSYTIIVAPKGKGKGTGIRRAVKFFSQPWYSVTGVRQSPGLTVQGTTDGLLSGCRDFVWKPKGIGAWMSGASSVPGMARLCKELENTAKNAPHLTWCNTLPRILSVYEEMKNFLSTLFIEGGVGSGMEGVVCQLWDDVSFNGTATGTRDAVYGEMMFSLLAGVTEEDWFDLLGRGNAVGGGLMSRFNIIGTEGKFENVSKMVMPDFTSLRETFLPRVVGLEDARVRIVPSEGADRVIGGWVDKLPEGSERLNVHAWRSALLLAWLRHEEVISDKTAQDAVLLGQYQVHSHDYYQPRSADTPIAKVQAKITRALSMHGPMSKRELQRKTSAHRDGTELWKRAFDGLVNDGYVGKRTDGLYCAVG